MSEAQESDRASFLKRIELELENQVFEIEIELQKAEEKLKNEIGFRDLLAYAEIVDFLRAIAHWDKVVIRARRIFEECDAAHGPGKTDSDVLELAVANKIITNEFVVADNDIASKAAKVGHWCRTYRADGARFAELAVGRPLQHRGHRAEITASIDALAARIVAGDGAKQAAGASKPRRGRLPTEQSNAVRASVLAKASQTPGLARDYAALAQLCGTSYKTVSRIIKKELEDWRNEADKSDDE